MHLTCRLLAVQTFLNAVKNKILFLLFLEVVKNESAKVLYASPHHYMYFLFPGKMR